MKLTLRILLAALATFSVAAADWAGQTIGVQYLHPNITHTEPDLGAFVVGPGPEGFIYPTVPVFHFDITPTQIVMDFDFGVTFSWNVASFNGPRFYDYLGTAPDLTGASVNPLTTMVGLDDSDLIVDANNVYVNWQGLDFFPDMKVVIDLQFAPVPEASTWSAGGAVAGLIGLAWFRRYRRYAAGRGSSQT